MIAVPIVTAPAASRARPNGIFAPENASAAPIARNATDTTVVIMAITFWISSLRPFQLRAITETREVAPIAISAIPRGIHPEKARIAPSAKVAPLTSNPTLDKGEARASGILFQFRAAADTSVTAPTAISAIPSPVATPVKANIAPTAREAPARTPVKVVKASVRCWSLLCQLITAAVTRLAPPKAIKAIPRGRFAPENAIIAPRASRKPPTTPVMRASVLASSLLIAVQFSPTVAARPTAPAAIRPTPSGIFTPVTTRIAPTASIKPETIMVISARVSSIIFLISPMRVCTASPRKS